MKNDVLPEFQKFLFSHRLVQKKYISYYAYWSSKFLSFSNNNQDLNHDLQVHKFLDHLKSHDNAADWQIRQAHDAIRLYFNHYKNNSEGNMQKKHSLSDINDLVDKVREAIRIRHYSLSTERTYIHWVTQFTNYIKEIKKGTTESFILESEDVRSYLSYLALRKIVSASTQNQAFNAILFFFRYVLNCIEGCIKSASKPT